MTAPPNEATRRQIRAARPDSSTWLGANAGSGKTRVLTDRVARLLLRGADPQSILCVTYTKAAAAEMQNRLFGRLGEWAMLDDAPLTQALSELGVDVTPDGALLAKARRLFAAAIETPGGLKIQTIHAFCGMILRRFPLEAGVTPGFTEMDDATTAELLDTALNDLALTAPEVFAACAGHVTDTDLYALAMDVMKRRAALDPAPDRALLADRLGVPPGLDAEMVRATVLTPGTWQDIETIVPVLLAGSTNDVKLGKGLQAVLRGADDPMAIQSGLEGVLLTQDGKVRKALGTKETRTKLGGLADALDDLAQRVFAGRDMRRGLVALDRHRALHDFATAVLDRIDRLKQQRGVLDFNDLIERTVTLLNAPGVADWVLYKLDGGIDHVLVDEAQDTAPRQWDVIAKLTESFTSEIPDEDTLPRTLFVVGDFKQSIYSFQGADPAQFTQRQAAFDAAHRAVGRKLETEALEHSFRSSPAVLEVVDRVFDGDPLSALNGPPHHIAFKQDLPGRVDLWEPVCQDRSAQEEDPWYTPVDAIHAQDDRVVLANRVADEIKRLIAEEALPTKDGPRAIHAGDILVLVQRRIGGLFDEIISACKARDIAVAGADRLKLGGELAVQDILATLRFVDLTDDSLSLAAALRSPLFGLSVQDLHRLAAGRPKGTPLWVALRDGDAHRPVVAMLQDLLQVSDFLRPYDLIDRVLTRHGARARLIERLGQEAADGIDAVLSSARQYERAQPASLTGFLAWMDSTQAEIKRQPEAAGRALRVMTVHGAKGLEAPIVILPDTANRQITVRDDLLENPRGGVLWKGRREDWIGAVETAVETGKLAIAAEWQRLLYVAMTRAENWLIVCAAGKTEPKDSSTTVEAESWYCQVAAAMQAMGAADYETPTGPGLRHSHGDWPARPFGDADGAVGAPDATPPDWLLDTIAAPPSRAEPLRASALPGPKALPGEGLPEDMAKQLGTLTHGLLEDLPDIPADQRDALARTLLRRRAPDLDADLSDAIRADVLRVLDDPALRPLFAPDTLAEVAISVNMPDGQRLRGVIDRLIVTDDHVHAIDYKTNRALPATAAEVPSGVLAQMGAYALGLQQLYPGRSIQLSILWTRSGAVMDIPMALATSALPS